jgi:hypothetical protein
VREKGITTTHHFLGDMSGAAAVVASVQAIAKLGLPINVCYAYTSPFSSFYSILANIISFSKARENFCGC